MGTNFYCVTSTSDVNHKTPAKLLGNKNYEDNNYPTDSLNKNVEEYHIGKHSLGWQFIFQASCPAYRVPWQSNLESIINYLKSNDCYICDEYDNVYSVDEFFKVIKDSLYHDINHININNVECEIDKFLSAEFTASDGTQWCETDFC
jgi:hypothetical protein